MAARGSVLLEVSRRPSEESGGRVASRPPVVHGRGENAAAEQNKITSSLLHTCTLPTELQSHAVKSIFHLAHVCESIQMDNNKCITMQSTVPGGSLGAPGAGQVKCQSAMTLLQGRTTE